MNDEGNGETFTLSLGYEELVVLLRMLKARSMLGLKEEPLEDFTDEQAAIAMGVAERSLRAQGIVSILEDSNTIEIEPAALSIIGTCAYPHRSHAVLVFSRDGEIAARYYHERDRLMVEHMMSGNGIHDFTVGSDKEVIIDRIVESFSLADRPRMDESTYQLSMSELEVLGRLMKEKSIEDIQNGESAVGDGDIKQCAQILAESTKTCLLVGIEYPDDAAEASYKNMAVIAGDNGIWVINGVNGKEDALSLQNMSTNDAIESTRRFVTGMQV